MQTRRDHTQRLARPRSTSEAESKAARNHEVRASSHPRHDAD